MAQSVLSFFDDRYFSKDCSCDLTKTSDEGVENCKLHFNNIAKDNEENELNRLISDNKPIATVVKRVEINQSFPRQPNENLINLIEYRIKVLSSQDIMFHAGEVKMVHTNTCVTRKAGRLSMLMKASENLPLRFLSEGLINPTYRGYLPVNLQNPSGDNVYISAGSLICYLILTPFIE